MTANIAQTSFVVLTVYKHVFPFCLVMTNVVETHNSCGSVHANITETVNIRVRLLIASLIDCLM